MKTLLSIFLLILSFKASAIVFEVSGDFEYDKQRYGTNRENSVVSRSYSAGISAYIFSTTAIDLSYSFTNDITSNNERYTITGYSVDHISDQQRVETSDYGIGIKQMLLPKGYVVTPVVSVGYAREFVKSSSDTTYLNTATGTNFYYNAGTTKYATNSVFGIFSLQFHLTDRLSLKGSVKTIFPAFDFNKAKDNIKYSFGFSWMF